MEGLTARLRRNGIILLIGFLLIIYIALGFVYLQQGAKQGHLKEEIDRINLILVKPLPSDEKLRAEYEEVNRSIAPITVNAALDIIVDIASRSGINVDPVNGKLVIPSAAVSQQKAGEGNYEVLSFKNISVQGDHDSVMAFVSDLDSGNTLKTMVLRTIAISQVELMLEAEEAARRTEYHDVSSAVIEMMTDNDLAEIPNPINYAGGTATNLMGDDPETEAAVEGFPDITTTADDRGYTGAGTPSNGYVLYGHDKIDPADTEAFATVSYVTLLKTAYYYTCEWDGRVRQFDGPDVATAKEYVHTEVAETETVVTLDVDIYTKPEGG